jgi:hypothetical protein
MLMAQDWQNYKRIFMGSLRTKNSKNKHMAEVKTETA